MRLDAHQHFWRYDPRRDTWIGEDMAALKRDFLPAEFARELATNDIDGSIAVQTDQTETETQFLLQLASNSPAIAGVVGWIDLRDPAIEKRLHFFSQFEKLRGFRHIVQAEADDRFALHSDFIRGVRALRPFHYAYDLLVYPRQLPAAIRLVEKLPEQRFVLNHIAKPNIKAGLQSPWREYIYELATSPNVHCKLSGLVTEADWEKWKPEDFTPYLDVVFEAFGAGRLMFGSDWPVCLLAANYAKVKALVSDYVRQAAPDSRDAIFGENAARFYRVKNLEWTCS